MRKKIEPIIVKVFVMGIHTKGDQETRTATILYGRDEIIKVLTEEIEKMENPHVASSARIGFDHCRHKILALLNSK